MEIGKVSNEELREYVFKNIKNNRKEVLIDSQIGLDTAILDFENDLIVTSVDPITGATKNIGKLAVNVSCNDVACGGAEPVAILMSVLLPPSITLEELETIVKDAQSECKKLNIDIIGGHTEVTDSVNRVIITTTVLGRAKKNELPDISKIKSTDIIAISKSIGIEGSNIIYKERDLGNLFNDFEKRELESFQEMISVVDEAKIAKKYNVKYMHDITEGGLYGALWESAQVINKKIVIQKDAIPIKNVTKKIVNYLNIDVFRLISSGSMIFIMSNEDFKNFEVECKENSIDVFKIGEIFDGSGFFVQNQDGIEKIKNTTTDELYKVISL